jgi:hypothetical protein
MLLSKKYTPREQYPTYPYAPGQFPGDHEEDVQSHTLTQRLLRERLAPEQSKLDARFALQVARDKGRLSTASKRKAYETEYRAGLEAVARTKTQNPLHFAKERLRLAEQHMEKARRIEAEGAQHESGLYARLHAADHLQGVAHYVSKAEQAALDAELDEVLLGSGAEPVHEQARAQHAQELFALKHEADALYHENALALHSAPYHQPHASDPRTETVRQNVEWLQDPQAQAALHHRVNESFSYDPRLPHLVQSYPDWYAPDTPTADAVALQPLRLDDPEFQTLAEHRLLSNSMATYQAHQQFHPENQAWLEHVPAEVDPSRLAWHPEWRAQAAALPYPPS